MASKSALAAVAVEAMDVFFWAGGVTIETPDAAQEGGVGEGLEPIDDTVAAGEDRFDVPTHAHFPSPVVSPPEGTVALPVVVIPE